jgi:hypothetical protein
LLPTFSFWSLYNALGVTVSYFACSQVQLHYIPPPRTLRSHSWKPFSVVGSETNGSC